MQSQDIPVLPSVKEKCTLPSWCIYIAYILCFLLCSFSVIVVILYCFKFGYEESLEWVVAFIFSLFQSILLIEPVKVIYYRMITQYSSFEFELLAREQTMLALIILLLFCFLLHTYPNVFTKILNRSSNKYLWQFLLSACYLFFAMC